MPGLDKSFLYKIMRRSGEIEDDGRVFAETTDFIELASKPLDPAKGGLWYIDKHLVFLQECGFVSLGSPTQQGKRSVRLTALGQTFVQPELADFMSRSLLPEIIGSLEEHIKTLTYPEEEKNGLLYRLREAVAKHTPDMIVKIFIEVATLYAKGHGI